VNRISPQPEPIPPTAPTDVVVVGAGRWGALHVEKLRAMPGVRLVAVVDVEFDRAVRVAARTSSAMPLASLDGLERLGLRPGAALVATSIGALASVGRELLTRGWHVLVEKPVAASSFEARQLCRLADAAGRTLAAGFVERFNLPPGTPPGAHRQLVVRRTGPGSPGAGRLDLDWLVHDLDLAGWLLGPNLQVVGARTLPAGEGLSVRLAAPDGRAARIDVLRGRPRTYRRLWLDGRRIDLKAPTHRDALTAQWQAFLATTRGAPSPLLARGDAAARALSLVEAVRTTLTDAERAAG
jgi:predicted dehydrogenase